MSLVEQWCVANLKQYLTLVQGRPTRGPSRIEWPAEYFLKLSAPSILAEIEDRFDVKTPFFLFFFQVLEITTILRQKVENLKLISGEDFFFSFFLRSL